MATSNTPGPSNGAEQADFTHVMDEAVDAATRARPPGEAPPTAETIAAARRGAAALLESLSPPEGADDLRNLTLSMGLPAARAVFRQMIANSGVQGKAKAQVLETVAGLSPITEIGCMKVDYHNRMTGRADVAYLLIDQCPRDHDLGREIAKIRPNVAEDKWPTVLDNLSMLVFITRSVYANIARSQTALIRTLFGLAETDNCARYVDLQVDPTNTTLYLDDAWPERVGIYIKLDAETQAEVAAESKTK